MPYLEDQHHRHGGKDDDGPVLQRHGDAVEKLIEDLYDKELPHHNDRENNPESTAALEVKVESASPRPERPRIEHIPEMRPDEDGEEQCLLVGREMAFRSRTDSQQIGHTSDVGMLENIEENPQHGEEEQADTKNLLHHPLVED